MPIREQFYTKLSLTKTGFTPRAPLFQIRVKGNEGVTMSGRTLEWNADQDIFLRSLNGSLVLDGGVGGLFVEVSLGGFQLFYQPV